MPPAPASPSARTRRTRSRSSPISTVCPTKSVWSRPAAPPREPGPARKSSADCSSDMVAARGGRRTEGSASSRVRVHSATAGREPHQLPPDAATQGRERVAARKSAGASLPPRQRPCMRRAGCRLGEGRCACAVPQASERISVVALTEGWRRRQCLSLGGLDPGAALSRPHVAVSAEAGARGLPGLGRTAGGAGRVLGAPGGPQCPSF